MSTPLLIIGNKNYSSWSLRPWILMKVLGLAFDEKLIPMFDENWDAAIAAVSPSQKGPGSDRSGSHGLGNHGHHGVPP